MDSRERILLALERREADRVAIQDSPWTTTIERWHREGLPADTTPQDYFDFEMVSLPSGDQTLRLERKVIEETDEYIVERNPNGAVLRNFKHSTSTPELIGFALDSRSAWEELKPRLEFSSDRIDFEKSRRVYDEARAKGKFVVFATAVGYDLLSTIVGPGTLLPAMLTDPDWVTDMVATWADLTIACAEELLAGGLDFDGAFLFDDMGHRDRPFFSNQVYRAILKPHHKRLCDFFHSHGKKVLLHSCGYVAPFIPDLIEAGFDCLQPLEVKAGMDLLDLKKRYGDRLAFMGGVDVRTMCGPPEVREREIRLKVGEGKRGGGYIFHSDHSVPDDVSFSQYCDVIRLVHKYGSFGNR